jgi:hypothetical protein
MYQYKLRPGYGSHSLLLEFIKGHERKQFLHDMFDAFSELNFKTTSTEHLWMNDEMLINIESTAGKFQLSKDIWDNVFIMADENQDGLMILNKFLLDSGKFEKIDVDFNDYELKKE